MKALASVLFACVVLSGCVAPVQNHQPSQEPEWKQEFSKVLPLLGHRNWILVVDKAFPLQNSPGIRVIETGEPLTQVMNTVVNELDGSTHVKPVYYRDAEIDYLLPDQTPGLETYRKSLGELLKGNNLQPLLHDSVFVKIDSAAKLFTVLVLKTEETVPYSSVFIELDCRYWNRENEEALRQRMARGSGSAE